MSSDKMSNFESQHSSKSFSKLSSDYHTDDLNSYSKRELMLAFRNHGIHYEGLLEDITPVGMHYLLIHFDIPRLNWNSYRLKIGCADGTTRIFTMNDIISRPKVSIPVTMECAGNGRTLMKPRCNTSQPWDMNAVGNSLWGGTSLASILHECGYGFDSSSGRKPFEILFTGGDKGIQQGVVHKYQRSLSFDDAMQKDVMLAYEMNGQKLLPQHGYPLRLIVPGFYGMTSVKWLESIECLDHKFEGPQMKSYVIKESKEDMGIPVFQIIVKSLIVPPGIPDWLNRHRFVEEGDVLLEGRAWAGKKQVIKVEVAIDGVYSEASMDEPMGQYAWRRWFFNWKAARGKYILSVRATDENGNTQSEEGVWNFGGFANNVIQKLKVVVKTKEELELGELIDVNKETLELERMDILTDWSHGPTKVLSED